MNRKEETITIFLGLIIIGLALLTGCNDPNASIQMPDTCTPAHKKNLRIETLSEQVEQGLHKVTIDDTVHVLIYRGVESVTMIQIK